MGRKHNHNRMPHRVHAVGVIAALVTLLAFHSGCARPKRRYEPPLLTTQGRAARYVKDILENPDADVRRGAIEHLAHTRHRESPRVVDVMALAARMDASDLVRCAAARALAERGGPSASATLLTLLDKPSAAEKVLSAGDAVRWEAVKGLQKLTVDGRMDHEEQTRACETGIRLLAGDPSRDVRLVAAQMLGRCGSVESAQALVQALRQSDFGVVYESERSLMRLTGRSGDRDAARWQSWLDSTPDPFADRGRLNEMLDPPARRSWWPWQGAP
jgi:HEAT repeat protein